MPVTSGTGVSMGWMSVVSTSHLCESTEENAKPCPRLVTYPYPSFIHYRTPHGKGVATISGRKACDVSNVFKLCQENSIKRACW